MFKNLFWRKSADGCLCIVIRNEKNKIKHRKIVPYHYVLPISCYWSLSITPETIWKPLFPEGIEKAMTWNRKSFKKTSFFVLYITYRDIYRRSHPRILYKKRVFKIFAKFTGKHLCQNLFFNKVAGLSL